MNDRYAYTSSNTQILPDDQEAAFGCRGFESRRARLIFHNLPSNASHHLPHLYHTIQPARGKLCAIRRPGHIVLTNDGESAGICRDGGAGDHKGPLHHSTPRSPLRRGSTSDFNIALWPVLIELARAQTRKACGQSLLHTAHRARSTPHHRRPILWWYREK